MENETKSPVKGIVDEANFKAGHLVDAAHPIVEMSPEKESWDSPDPSREAPLPNRRIH
ncbi:MAG: hypothetical protein JSV10_01175 [Candidatus Zixiibacteriota bacterium]|nr:MAG: hypothetical protein JSV10_01175 [candidate division Zixibacteria bacterium]